MSFTTFQTLVCCVKCHDMTWRLACTRPWPAADRKRLWEMVEKMGRRVVKKTFMQSAARAFQKWRSAMEFGRAMQYERAGRTLLNMAQARAFNHWKSLVAEKVVEEKAQVAAELSTEIRTLQKELHYWKDMASNTMDKLHQSADVALRRMGAGAAHGAIKHWHSVAQIAKRYGHMQNVVDRAKKRAIERIVNRLLAPAFAKW